MIQSVDRALSLLNHVALRPDGVGVREIARECKLKAPTAQALLKTLQANGYLAFDMVTRRYKLGMGIIALMRNSPHLSTRQEVLEQCANDIVEESGETAAIASLYSNELHMLSFRRSQAPLAVQNASHFMVPTHYFAVGQALLSWSDDDTRQEYIAKQTFTEVGENEPADAKELIRALEENKERGYSLCENFRESGIIAIAVPVMDNDEFTNIAVGCSGPITRMQKQLDENVHILKKHAQTLARQLALIGEAQ